MAINEETRNALREMGLNAYEVDAYITLLEGGQMTAMDSLLLKNLHMR